MTGTMEVDESSVQRAVIGPRGDARSGYRQGCRVSQSQLRGRRGRVRQSIQLGARYGSRYEARLGVRQATAAPWSRRAGCLAGNVATTCRAGWDLGKTRKRKRKAEAPGRGERARQKDTSRHGAVGRLGCRFVLLLVCFAREYWIEFVGRVRCWSRA